MRNSMSLEGYKYLLAVGNIFCYICSYDVTEVFLPICYVIPVPCNRHGNTVLPAFACGSTRLCITP